MGNRLLMVSVKLPVNSRQLVVKLWGSWKLYLGSVSSHLCCSRVNCTILAGVLFCLALLQGCVTNSQPTSIGGLFFCNTVPLCYFLYPATTAHFSLPSRHAALCISLPASRCVWVSLELLPFPSCTRSFAVTYAASIPLMNRLCCTEVFFMRSPNPPSCSSYSLAVLLPSAAAQANCISRKRACVSSLVFLFSKLNILVSTVPHKIWLLRAFTFH